MRRIFLFTVLLFLCVNSYGQKMTGVGGELSAISLKPNVRWWVSRTSGFEIFGGIASEFTGLKFNDFEGGVKYLRTILYNRNNRTYIGLVGKWKWVDLDEEEANVNINLPVTGAFIGKEWFSKRAHLKGFAIELGYQYGVTHYHVYPNDEKNKTYTDFPLIINLRYSLYKKR